MNDEIFAIVLATFVALSAMCMSSSSMTAPVSQQVHIASLW